MALPNSQPPSDEPTGAFDPVLDAGLAAAFGPESTPGGWSQPPLLRDDSSGNAPLVQPSSPEMPRSADARYQLLGEIARGGMGVILKGRDPDLGRDLAVKVLKAELAGRPAAEQRFVEEAQVGGQLQHPGVVPVYDLGRFADGRPYFAMKLVKGHTLAELLTERSDPVADRGRFLRHFLQVCQTVAYAHSKGVIHRDLKPANIMVGAFDEVLVMDWGLAKVLSRGGVADERRASHASPERERPEADPAEIRTIRFGSGSDTAAGSVMGTPAYMPPEQAGGETEKLDERVDVFGLGAILCVVLTGKPPYVGPTGEAVRQMAVRGLLAEAFARLDECGADAELVALCKRCLAADRDARPRHAGEVAAALAAHLAGVEDRAHKAELDRAAAEARAAEEANTRRAAEGKVVAERKRRRAQLALAAAVGLLAVAGGAFGWYADRQVTERRLKAEAAREQVNRLVALATDLRREYRFAAAAAALAEARDDAGAVPDLLPVVEQATSDLALVVELDAVQSRASTWIVGREGKSGDFDRAAAPAGYRQAFAERGLDVAADPEGVGARVATSAVRAELLAALDDWLVLETDETLGRQVLACLRRADPDSAAAPFRDPAIWKDKQRLAKLVEGVDAASLPPGTVVAIARVMARRKMESAPLLRQAVTHHPRNFEVVFALAQRVDLLPANLDERIGAYRTARALRPDHYATLINLGDCLRDKNDLVGAIALHREAARIDPASAHARIHLAIAVRMKGDVDGAIAYLREAVQLDPKNPGAYLNLGWTLCEVKKDYDKAAECFRQGIRLDPKIAYGHFWLGNALSHKIRSAGKDGQADLNEAMTAYLEAIRLDPKHASAHINLGGLLCDVLHNYDGAIGHFREAIRIESKNSLAHYCLGIALDRKMDLDGVVDAYREAARLDPGNALYHFKLGLALDDKKDLDGAITSYKEAIKLDPNYTDAHFNLGAVLTLKKDIDGAVAAFREAARLDPKDAPTHFSLGNALFEKGDLNAAVASLRKAILLDPKYAEAHYNLGVILSAKGDGVGAIASYKDAIQLNPMYAAARYALARVLASGPDEVRDAKAAVEQATRACELTKWKEPPYLDTLAAAYAEAGDFAKAVELQKKAISFAAGDKDLDAELRDRLALYEKKQPYRDPRFVVRVERGPPPREVKR